MNKKVTLVISLSALLLTSMPATANDFTTNGWDDAFNATLTATTAQNGDWTLTAVFTDTVGADLLIGPSAGAGELRNYSLGVRLCDDNQQLMPSASGTRPANCTAIPQPTNNPSSSIAGSPEALTITWTFTSGDIDSWPSSHQCMALSSGWDDQNGTSRYFFTPFLLVPGASTCTSVTSVASAETAPIKYAGPEFSGLSAKGIMAGTTPRLEGRNLDEISSIEIGGKAATFKLDGDKALDLTLPDGLAPGLYDLVINSSAGKLTHINAIQVREPKRAFSITTRSEGRISEDQYREHTIISAMQIPELNKARCIVNGSNLALAKAQAERLCALVAAANPSIETTVVEARSTVRNSAVFARVTYGWN